MDRRGLRKRNITQLIFTIAVVVLVALLSGLKFFRVDLTAEKKYTLSASSRQLMKELEERVYVRIYLDGDLPAEFINFRQSIRELMDDYRAYAGDRLQY